MKQIEYIVTCTFDDKKVFSKAYHGELIRCKDCKYYECGCKVNRANPLKGNIWNYYYCPNCGARMDAEREEE